MTDWQDKQSAILDRVEERINALPKRIANDLRYGLYRECRSLVETLNMSKNSGSAHDGVERMVRELVADMELLHACVTARPTVPDTVQAPDDQPVGLEKAFIDGWMACRSAYGATDPEDVDHGVECPRAHGDRECHCNEDAVREWAELEWADRPDTSSAVQAPDVAAPSHADLVRAIADPGSFLPRGDNYRESIPSWSARAVRALLGTDTTQDGAS